MINKIKNTVPWTYVIHDLNNKEIRTFMKTNCKRLLQYAENYSTLVLFI